MNFREFLISKSAEDKTRLREDESTSKIRTHISHLEDLVIDSGRSGGQKSIDFIKSFLTDYHKRDSFVITKKVDGAPAVVFGIANNKKFFVSTKSAFNKTPRVFYSAAEIRLYFADKSEDLMKKLEACFNSLEGVVKRGVYQGDLLFAQSQDIKHEKIDGKDYLTFRPNTITYAVEPSSKYGKAITRATIGLVVHTTLNGQLGNFTPEYTVNFDNFKKSADVFMIGNKVHDVSEELHLDDHDRKAINGHIRSASELLKNLNDDFLKMLSDNSFVRERLHKFINTQVANGDFVAATDQYLKKFHSFVDTQHTEKIASLKSAKHKEAAQSKRDMLLDPNMDSQFSTLFAFMEQIAEAKKIIIHQLSEIDGISSYINDSEWKKISGEGLVVADTISHDIVKFVDRTEFSKANFNLANNWRT